MDIIVYGTLETVFGLRNDMSKHYMRLLTDVELNEKQKHVWYRTVERFLGAEYDPQPENFLDQLTSDRDELEGDDEYPFVYVVYLSDDIDTAMAEQVVNLWSEIYPRDFQIESSAEFDSSLGCGDDDESCEIEIDDAMHEEIQRRASKFLHNRWVEEQTRCGWRYGISENASAQTSPRLRDWDSLHEDYRRELDMDREQAVKFLKSYPHLFV